MSEKPDLFDGKSFKRPGGPIANRPVQGLDGSWYDGLGNQIGSEAEHREAAQAPVIARTEQDLPVLLPEHVRLVHFTSPEQAESIALTGLDYHRQGMIDSTTLAYSQAEDAVFTSEDSRFSHPDTVAVVLDVPFDEYRLHRNVTLAPGVVSAKYVVGLLRTGDVGKEDVST